MTPINLARSLLIAATIAINVLNFGCKQSTPRSAFVVAHVDRQIAANSTLPLATDPNLVGTYSADTKSGAGYFYDDVLEYRVWLHPKNGAESLNGNNDYFVAFAQYEHAEEFAKETKGAEPPLVLVRQREWINEPKHGQFTPEKGSRITEWQVAWLKGSKRKANSIQEFMKHPYEAEPQ